MNQLSLESLATQIEHEHQQAVEHARSAIEHARECGRLLTEAKGRAYHGGWTEWIRRYTTINPRQAQRYMKVFREWEAIKKANGKETHALTIEDAIASIPKRTPKTTSKSFLPKKPLVSPVSAADDEEEKEADEQSPEIDDSLTLTHDEGCVLQQMRFHAEEAASYIQEILYLAEEVDVVDLQINDITPAIDITCKLWELEDRIITRLRQAGLNPYEH